MENIKNILEKHTIVVVNEALKRGFVQIPNYVLRDGNLSFGARLSYAVLLSYAWQEDSCFPGQERMAQDLKTSERMLRNYLKELKDAGYISWKQRGLNKTNVYYIEDYRPVKSEVDRKHSSGQGRKPTSHQDRKHSSD